MRVVCIGDSITAGQYLPDGEKAWPALLEGVEVIARGVSNDTTRLGLERFPRDVQEMEPDVVVIQFGLNDCNHWESDRGLPRVSELAFIANLKEMIRRVRAFDALPMLCTLTPTLKGPTFEAHARAYSQMVCGAANDGAELVDVRAAFHASFVMADLLLPDGVHLSAKGHKVYARAVQRAFDRVLVPA